MVVFNDKDEIKSAENRALELNILIGFFRVIPATFDDFWKKKMQKTAQIDNHMNIHTLKYIQVLSAIVSTYPKTELAAARTLALEFKVVVIPAFAMDMVCCSIAS